MAELLPGDTTATGPVPSPGVESARPSFPAWPIALLAAPIVLRATVYAAALLFEPWKTEPGRMIPAGALIVQAAFYALIALLLVFSGRRDRRAWSLGLFILDAGATLAESSVRTVPSPSFMLALSLHLRTDAFQAALLWFFASEFPKPAENKVLARTFHNFTSLALVLGALLFALDAYASINGGQPGLLTGVANAVRRQSSGAGDWYFSLQFLLLVPLLVIQPFKLRECGPEDRKRFKWLVAGLAAGYAPLMIEVFLETFVPGYIDWSAPYLRLRGVIIMAGWTLVPISAAYAALFQRTLDLRLILRAAVQYVLARSVIRVLVALPLVLLIMLIVANRDVTLVNLVSGTDGLVLVTLVIVAAGAALARTRLLLLVDRGFLREPIDIRRTLTDVLDSVRRASSVEQICQTTTEAIARALHPKFSFICLAASDGVLHAQDADMPPLSVSGVLVQLVGDKTEAVVVDAKSAAIFDRMPEEDRAWIRSSHATLLVGLRAATGEVHGLISLGEKKSELDYSDDEKSLLEAIGSAAGLALDRVLTGERSAADEADVVPAARECVSCGTVVDPAASRCTCGGMLTRSPVPLIFEERLRLQSRIGAGGMGVVYKAIDLRLDQARAVKTLPKADVTMVARLRREARAMAAVQHPNLAILHNLEFWRGRPLLVMEFLEGGSLADRVRFQPLTLQETTRIALEIGGALGALHGAGILHRDIKPSNIAFNAAGTPKLLDFGLAKFIPSTAETTTLLSDPDGSSDSFSTIGAGIRGTPAYMSPELLLGGTPSVSDDLWSLSVTLLEAHTGTNPFKAPTIAESMSRVLTSDHWIDSATSTLPSHVGELFKQLLGDGLSRPSNVAEWMQKARETN